MIDSLTDQWRRRRWSRPRYTNVRRYARMSDLPQLPPRRTVVIVGPPEREQWVVFACPCGHQHRIVLNLSAHRDPRWTLTLTDDEVSLSPSIDSKTDQLRCHFWLRAGRVHWAVDQDRSPGLRGG